MTAHDSLPELLSRLRAGDAAAATDVVGRFSHRLIALARSQLDARLGSKLDAEDIVQSVYRSFFSRQRGGDFALPTWDSLWALLCIMTVRKCADKADYFLADCRDARREVGPPDADTFQGREPTPAEAAALTDLVERLLHGLDAEDREVVVLHLQGWTQHQISARLDRAHRTVRRVIARARKRLLRLYNDEGQAPSEGGHGQ